MSTLLLGLLMIWRGLVATAQRLWRVGPRVRAGLAVCLLTLMGWFTGPTLAAEEFLPADQAFQVQASAGPGGDLLLEFAVAPKTYLYREQVKVAGLPAAVQFGPLQLPPGLKKYDETFAKEVEVYYGLLSAQVRLLPSTPAGQAFVAVGYQGCADAGLCYPPQTRLFRLMVGSGGQVTAVSPATAEDAKAMGQPANAVPGGTSAPVGGSEAQPGGSSIERALASGNLFKIAGVFFIAGLLLSFTPCVLPMVPILSSIIVGEGAVGRGRGFLLALSYSQGMALVYTALGVAAGLLGEGLAASLQHPWVLGSFAVLLILLALSMFGAYELQMPGFIQHHLTRRSGQLKGGSLAGVFVMGMLSALIVGPCVTGPLAGALVYLSQTRDVVLGGGALYALAWGMSMPLLLVGVSAGTLLPTVGAWMEAVKTFFGMVLLGAAWWLVSPVLPAMALLGSLGVLLALGGAFLGAFDTMGPQASIRHRTVKALGWVLVVLAAFQLFGAATGAASPWAPLSELKGAQAATGGAGSASANKAALPFKRVATPAQLDEALAQAASQGQVAMVDFYADWCVACIEFEHKTFTDATVREHMGRAYLIKADVTDANRSGDQAAPSMALLRRFGLFGPPGIIFMGPDGHELPGTRVIGFQPPDEFTKHLKAAGL